MEKNNYYDCVIVGGGASGLFCASNLPDGIRTLIIEHNNKLGSKLLITGKGRCNVTSACDREEFFDNIHNNGKFFRSSFSQFSNNDTIEFFEKRGCALKIERGKRVFPQSDKASSVLDCLKAEVQTKNTAVIYENVNEVLKENNSFVIVTDNNKYCSDYLVIATGGKSYKATGSDGSGYKLCESFGHTITDLKPSLVPLEVSPADLCRNMMGLSLKNVSLKLVRNNKCIYEDLGEALFTHFGLSGPLVLSASAYAEKNDKIIIDLKPGLSAEQLDARILSDFKKYTNKNFSNSLSDLLPSKLIPTIVTLSGIDPATKVNSITKDQRRTIVSLLKGLSFTVVKPRPIDEAIITSGGVSVKEIEPKSLESKLVSNLYIVGELLDIDAYTGGFNLQIAFSTAYCAAKSISNKINGGKMKHISIAIDGPSGAGKSTLAKSLAKDFNYIYVDTGAMYRTIAYYCKINNIKFEDEERVISVLKNIKIDIKYIDGSQHMFLNNEDVSSLIRSNDISMGASRVSSYPKVREYLLSLQRQFALENDVIMDGRDIGTVVLPDATVKIFLSSTPEERATRRFKEYQEKNESYSYEEILADIKKRDYNDSHRDIAPLKPADDAILLDNTSCETPYDSFIMTKNVINEVLKKKGIK